MFDVLLKELAKRLSLGERAPGLLGMLLSLIFDEKRGGFAGFIDRFRAKGLGDTLTSWLGNGENKSLSVAQLENVLGTQVIAQMASRLDLAPSAVGTALGQLLPTVIDKLSPDGRLPVGLALPDSAKAYLGNFGDFAQTAVLPEVLAQQAAQHTLSHGPAHAPAPATGSSKLWLLLIPVLIAPLFFIKQCSHAVVPSTPLAAPAIAAPVAVDATPVTVDAAAPITADVAAPPAVDAAAALESVITSANTSNEALLAALNLMSVRFDSNAATIKAESAAILEKAAAAIKKLPGLRLEVAGHTDNRGVASENQTLSEARATAVIVRLVQLGVDGAALKGVGYGDTQPVADNASKAGRARNRRMQFAIQTAN
jgi:outer membrane protein OmpA-like peptidoglycan-associated protein/uncharacterized protein YidB (DUF937 family)